MKTNKWVYLIMLASLVWAACEDDDDNGDKKSLNDTDEQFVEDAAMSNMAEIELGQLAVTKASDSLVRSFAQDMVDDHTQAQDELEDIANDFSGVDWPDDLNDDHQAIKDQLDSTAAGYSFDSLYIETQITMHQDARSALSAATTQATETRLKNYASKYLPVIEEHLSRADSLEMQISNDSTASNDTTSNASSRHY